MFIEQRLKVFNPITFGFPWTNRSIFFSIAVLFVYLSNSKWTSLTNLKHNNNKIIILAMHVKLLYLYTQWYVFVCVYCVCINLTHSGGDDFKILSS